MNKINFNLSQTKIYCLTALFISDLLILSFLRLITPEKTILLFQESDDYFIPTITIFIFNIFQFYLYNKIFMTNRLKNFYQIADQAKKDSIFRNYIYLPTIHYLIFTFSSLIFFLIIDDLSLELYIGLMFSSGFFIGLILYFIRLTTAMNWSSEGNYLTEGDVINNGSAN